MRKQILIISSFILLSSCNSMTSTSVTEEIAEHKIVFIELRYLRDEKPQELWVDPIEQRVVNVKNGETIDRDFRRSQISSLPSSYGNSLPDSTGYYILYGFYKEYNSETCLISEWVPYETEISVNEDIIFYYYAS